MPFGNDGARRVDVRRRLRDTFRLHDADSSGNLSAIELGNALQILGARLTVRALMNS